MKRVIFAVVFLAAACKDEQPGEGTPYPGCEGVDNTSPCGDDGICANHDDSTVCSPKCADDTDCPALGGTIVRCVGKTFCELVCAAPADCPDGMVCEANSACAWPKG